MSQYLQMFFFCFIIINSMSILLVEAGLDVKDYYRENNYFNGKGDSAYNKKYFPVKDAIYCEPNSPCIKPSGIFPNPSDCCSFYNCDDCRAFLQKCGKGTHFSPRLQACDYPEVAGCKAQNNYCHKKKHVKEEDEYNIDPRKIIPKWS